MTFSLLTSFFETFKNNFVKVARARYSKLSRSSPTGLNIPLT